MVGLDTIETTEQPQKEDSRDAEDPSFAAEPSAGHQLAQRILQLAERVFEIGGLKAAVAVTPRTARAAAIAAAAPWSAGAAPASLIPRHK